MARSTKKTTFYSSGERAVRCPRRQFHILLTEAERAKLVALSHARQMSAADVVRALIERAK